MSEYGSTERRTKTRSASSKRPAARTSTNRGGLKLGKSALSTAALLDIVERLGVVDMVAERVKDRLDEVDIDALIDDVGEYIRKNPEVLVVSLGAVTIATGAAVYLNKKKTTRRPSSSSSTTRGRA
jgi:hypothetical protein